MTKTYVHLVPRPKRLTGYDENWQYDCHPVCGGVQSNLFPEATACFVDYYTRMFGSAPCGEDSFLDFTAAPMKKGSYILKCEGGRAHITCADSEGAFYAITTLIQLLGKNEGVICCPDILVEDEPSCHFRSFMLDVARIWHDLETVKVYIDICRFYKINVFHIHFTDGASYTLPSRIYPKLSTPGRHFTFEQIAELRAYAASRGVQIMPEIDVPGHCDPFVLAYPEIFGTEKIIRQSFESIEAMKALFRELCEMFPESQYIHIGGDEAVISKWLADENDYYRAVGVDVYAENKEYQCERLLALFVNEMANTVFEMGRQPIAWEGFRKSVNDLVRKDLIVVSWENYYQVTPDLLEAGFKILNCTWKPMYVVTPKRYWSPREVYEWNIYSWYPIYRLSPYVGQKLEIEEDERVLGGGLCSWNDSIKSIYGEEFIPQGVDDEFRLCNERIPASAERLWTTSKEAPRTFEQFVKDFLRVERKLKQIIG